MAGWCDIGGSPFQDQKIPACCHRVLDITLGLLGPSIIHPTKTAVSKRAQDQLWAWDASRPRPSLLLQSLTVGLCLVSQASVSRKANPQPFPSSHGVCGFQ